MGSRMEWKCYLPALIILVTSAKNQIMNQIGKGKQAGKRLEETSSGIVFVVF